MEAKSTLNIRDAIHENARIHADGLDPSTLPDFMQAHAREYAKRSKQEIAYDSFRDGAKWGIEHGYSELLDENYSLHDAVIRLCSLFGVEPCSKCNANPVHLDDDWEPVSCEACDGNGWVPRITEAKP